MAVKPLLATISMDSIGVAFYLHSLSAGLRAAGIPHTVVCGGEPRLSVAPSDDVDVQRVEGLSAHFYDIFAFRADFRNLRRKHFSFVHIVSESRAGRLLKAARILRKPALLTVHRPVEGHSHYLIKKPVKLLITSSETIRESLVNRGSIPKARIRVLPYLVDAEGLSAMGGQKNEIPVIGFAATSNDDVGAEILIEAFSKLLARGLSCHLLLAGIEKARRNFRSLTTEPNLKRNITFIPAYPSYRDFLAAFDIYVLSSPKESEQTNTLLASMAAGKPVVTTVPNILQGVVEDGETALVVPKGDPDELADALTRLIKEHDFFNKLASAASDRVREVLPLRRSIDALLAVYDEVAGER